MAAAYVESPPPLPLGQGASAHNSTARPHELEDEEVRAAPLQPSLSAEAPSTAASLPPLPHSTSSQSEAMRRFRSRTVSFCEKAAEPLSPLSDSQDSDFSAPTDFFPRSVTHRPTRSMPSAPRAIHADVILQSRDSWATKMALLGSQAAAPRPAEAGDRLSPAPRRAATSPHTSSLSSSSTSESRLAKERARREARIQSQKNPFASKAAQRNYPGWGKIISPDPEVPRPAGYVRSASVPNSLEKAKGFASREGHALRRQLSLSERPGVCSAGPNALKVVGSLLAPFRGRDKKDL